MTKSLLLFLLVSFPLAAQEPVEARQRGIQVRAFAFALFDEIETLQLRSGENIIGEIELPTGQLRNRISVTARQFEFGEFSNDVFRPLGKVLLPEVGKDFILVFAPTASGYRVFPLRADDPEFRGNDKHVFNFSTRRLGILLGTSKQTVAPFENARLRPGFAKEATFYQAMFTYEENGKFIPFNNTRWPVNSNTKSLIFVFENPSTGKLAYRSVTELASP